MADFAHIWTNRSRTIAKYDALFADAVKNAPLEALSATNIQSLFRGSVVRALLTVKHKAATDIERVFRGSQARTFVSSTRSDKERLEDLAVFHYHAMILQRTFRGFYSRRYFHDYSARKAYIQSVVEKGNKLRETLAQNLENQRIDEQQRVMQEEAEEFKKVRGRESERKVDFDFRNEIHGGRNEMVECCVLLRRVVQAAAHPPSSFPSALPNNRSLPTCTTCCRPRRSPEYTTLRTSRTIRRRPWASP